MEEIVKHQNGFRELNSLRSPNFSLTSSSLGLYVGILNLDIHWKASVGVDENATTAANRRLRANSVEIMIVRKAVFFLYRGVFRIFLLREEREIGVQEVVELLSVRVIGFVG